MLAALSTAVGQLSENMAEKESSKSLDDLEEVCRHLTAEVETLNAAVNELSETKADKEITRDLSLAARACTKGLDEMDARLQNLSKKLILEMEDGRLTGAVTEETAAERSQRNQQMSCACKATPVPGEAIVNNEELAGSLTGVPTALRGKERRNGDLRSAEASLRDLLSQSPPEWRAAAGVTDELLEGLSLGADAVAQDPHVQRLDASLAEVKLEIASERLKQRDDVDRVQTIAEDSVARSEKLAGMTKDALSILDELRNEWARTTEEWDASTADLKEQLHTLTSEIGMVWWALAVLDRKLGGGVLEAVEAERAGVSSGD